MSSNISKEKNKSFKFNLAEWQKQAEKDILLINKNKNNNNKVAKVNKPKPKYKFDLAEFQKQAELELLELEKAKKKKQKKKAKLYIYSVRFIAEYTVDYSDKKTGKSKNYEKTYTEPFIKTYSFSHRINTEDEMLQAIWDDVDFEIKRRNSSYEDYTLIGIDIESFVSIDDVQKHGKSFNQIDTKLHAFDPIEFSWIPNLKNLTSNKGQCVYDALNHLYTTYPNRYPKIFSNRGKLLAFFNPLFKKDNKLNANQKALDDLEPSLEAVVEEELSLDDGVKPSWIDKLCRHYNISHYCLDIDEVLLLKFLPVNTVKNYSPLCYIAHSDHMYLITDKSFIQKFSQSRTNSIRSIVKEKKDTKIDLFATLPTHENIHISELKDQKDCNIIYSKPDLNSMVVELFDQDDMVYQNKSVNTKVVNIYLKHSNVTLFADPNSASTIQSKDDTLDWKKIRELCIKFKVPFTNQSFPSFVQNYVNTLIKPQRIEIPIELQQRILVDQNHKCAVCSEHLSKNRQIDHIIPLSAGGESDFDNLQALCKKCHLEKSNNEKENGEYMYIDPFSSTYNISTDKIMKSEFNKRHAFIERLGKVPNGFKSYYIDIVKSRKNGALHLTEDIPINTCMDNIRVFNKDEPLINGEYYVESDNTFPLRGNGFKSLVMVKYCLEQGIITRDNIKYVLPAQLVLDKNKFNMALNKLSELPGKLGKLGPNVLIGLQNKTEITQDKLFFTDNFNQASSHYLKNQQNNCHIVKIEGKKKVLYEVITHEKIDLEMTNSTIYNTILDVEAIELHKLKTMIEKRGGHVTYLNTDCCECWFDKTKGFPFSIDKQDRFSLKEFHWDNDKKIRKYRVEHKETAPHVERMAKHMVKSQFKFEQHNWSITNDPKHNDFKKLAVNILDMNKSNNISGIAGAGKTTLIREIIKELTIRSKKFTVLTPTNKSARLVNDDAMTIHRFVGDAFASSKRLTKKLLGLDYVIVDEISMVKEVFYKTFLTMKIIKPSLIFLIAGDWNQLAPINDRAKFDYEHSLALHELCDGNRLLLTECRRSDRELYDMSMTIINNGKVLKEVVDKTGNTEYPISICFTNKKRKILNEKWMKIKSNKVKRKFIKALEYDKNSQDMYIYKGLPIIARRNDRNLDIFNNETFKVVKFDDKIVEIKSEKNKVIEITLKQFPYLFYPGYSITTHRAQGSTIDTHFSIYEWGLFDKKLQYTAVTRATKAEYLNIII